MDYMVGTMFVQFVMGSYTIALELLEHQKIVLNATKNYMGIQ